LRKLGIAAIFRQCVVRGDLFENLPVGAIRLDRLLESRALFYQCGEARLVERL